MDQKVQEIKEIMERIKPMMIKVHRQNEASKEELQAIVASYLELQWVIHDMEKISRN